MTNAIAQHAALKPKERRTVMDVVKAAGISVAPWAYRKDGKRVKRPNANPKYCYEWAFGGGGEPSLLCVWYDSIAVEGNQIVYRDNFTWHAKRLHGLVVDQAKTMEIRARSIDQEARARRFDDLVKQTFQAGKLVRLVLLGGKQQKEVALGQARSVVKFRLLDPESWHVHSYDEANGSYVVVRGAPSASRPANAGDNQGDDAFNDIDEVPPGSIEPEQIFGTYSGFKRDESVRNYVRNKAQGKCEYCGQLGFIKVDGKPYVEVHHILSLADRGPDTIENVIALCADHHREAHYGKNRLALEKKMAARLKRIRP